MMFMVRIAYPFIILSLMKSIDRPFHSRPFPASMIFAVSTFHWSTFRVSLLRHTVQWTQQHGIRWVFIQPGKPAQNGFVERMNRTCREDVLDAYLLQNLEEAQELTEEWMMMFNNQRPHPALGNLTPYEYALVTRA